MHCVLLGVVKMLLTLWFDKSHSDSIFSISSKTQEVDQRLLNIKPPSFISRTGTAFSASPQKFRKGTNVFLTSNYQVLSQDCQDLLLKFPMIRLPNSRTFSFIMDCLAFTEFYQRNSTTISPSLCFPHTCT